MCLTARGEFIGMHSLLVSYTNLYTSIGYYAWTLVACIYALDCGVDM